MNLKNKSFLTLLDFTPEEITGLLDLAAELKAKKKAGSLKRRPPAHAARSRSRPMTSGCM